MMRAVFLTVIVLFAADAAACVCVARDPKTVFKNAHAVFLGEVIDEDESGDARMRVVERFKGAGGEVVKVSLGRMTSCSYPGATPPGSRHLIYGSDTGDGTLEAWQCSRSAPEERAACDLRYVRSRAGWWRSPLSSFRLFHWLGARRDPCGA